jgi:hypothetical protein
VGDQNKKNYMGGVCSIYIGKMRGAYMVLLGKPERKGPLGRSALRWEYKIEMDLQEVALRTWT